MRAVPFFRLMGPGLVAVAAACSHNPGPAATTPQPAPARTPAAMPYTGGQVASSGYGPTAATPAPVPAAASAPSANVIDMTGSWSGTVEYEGNSLGLDLNLSRAANGSYSGDVTPQGQQGAPLKSLTLDGNHVVMIFDAPDGEATFDMVLTSDRQAFSGNITYQGQQIPFTARRRN